MKKIMFNDRYGLTQAVLEGKKTMTRRIIKGNYEDIKAYNANGDWHFIADTDDFHSVQLKPQYEIGEKIAIAQSYRNLNERGFLAPEWLDHTCEDSPGYENKMFVRADLMPFCIRITDIQLQRLNEISDDDCLKEGVEKRYEWMGWGDFYFVSGINYNVCFNNPREAFAALIDRISGKGTWKSNPWVYAYSFELLKR